MCGSDFMLTLDVGCGIRYKGLVNLDIRITGYNPEVVSNQKLFMDCKQIPNFIRADGQYLPFQDSVFEIVYCSHLIEHVHRPLKLLKELIRVSRDKIIIECPHRLDKTAKLSFHKNYFNKTWFYEIIQKIPDVRILFMEYDYWQPIPFCGVIRLPHYIYLIIRVFKH